MKEYQVEDREMIVGGIRGCRVVSTLRLSTGERALWVLVCGVNEIMCHRNKHLWRFA